jgi:hypothetical protein
LEEDTVADIQKYVPRVQLMSSVEINKVFHSVWPTEASQWIEVGLHFTLWIFTVTDSLTGALTYTRPHPLANVYSAHPPTRSRQWFNKFIKFSPPSYRHHHDPLPRFLTANTTPHAQIPILLQIVSAVIGCTIPASAILPPDAKPISSHPSASKESSLPPTPTHSDVSGKHRVSISVPEVIHEIHRLDPLAPEPESVNIFSPGIYSSNPCSLCGKASL